MDINYTGKQVAILFVVLLISGGYAFGTILSYAGLVGGQSSGNNQQQQFNAQLPDRNFKEGTFNLSNRQETIIASKNDVVFVNAYYRTEQQKQQLMFLKQMTSDFNDRVYASVMNGSKDSSLAILYGVSNYPSVIVVGGNQNYRSRAFSDITEKKVIDSICSAFIQLKDSSAQCVY
ncbi:MAG: hypothetical protein ABEJ99_00375 [Candidatus Nanohaloarchaea archaeon]